MQHKILLGPGNCTAYFPRFLVLGSNRNFSRCEKRKAPTAIPAVPDLGRLTMPRKTNRAAARAVASGDVLWDKRKVHRKARKRALETQARRRAGP